MGTGPFDTDNVVCCPYCGNSKRWDHRGHFGGSGSLSVATQGRGSGDHDIVCDACGFDGGARTIGQTRVAPHPFEHAPKHCPMCGHGTSWVMGAPWALTCSGCGWVGELHIHDAKHNRRTE